MLCCVLIALVLGPLGLSATALGTGGACCGDRAGRIWTFGAAAMLVLACAAGAWIALAPAPVGTFTHICRILLSRSQ